MSNQGYYQGQGAPQYPQQSYGPPPGANYGPPPPQQMMYGPPQGQAPPPQKEKKDRGCLAAWYVIPPSFFSFAPVLFEGDMKKQERKLLSRLQTLTWSIVSLPCAVVSYARRAANAVSSAASVA
ncbi:hypothetical protein COCMIDRAFT_432 [Bipolaris oryzae ATCC 44560]|uniref:Cysteine-rich transmembrane CYSTM domain-containing protein n=1 Tax=Bipolaris oryzae ATCC 44560 TaxID=930090 RepID=W6ZTL0_COCMI|nr:uncharacterized protein COCMIDRAFT_432 [Bipolaris oryzae ATCC 44560]EUC50884.1 hypothetical protein COCMIDRAFT_432 [Bipolaris oryzae ATCC 44560]